MTTAALNNVWAYLQSLSLSDSDRHWLSERLAEPSAMDKAMPAATLSNYHTRIHKYRKRLSDEELAKRLAQYAPLTDADFPELSEADYAHYARSNSGRITKGLDKWL